jgi:hypothetical protein
MLKTSFRPAPIQLPPKYDNPPAPPAPPITLPVRSSSTILRRQPTSSARKISSSVSSASSGRQQRFLREPVDQTEIQGGHATLPCRVENKVGMLQWTRDGFGLGIERNLTGFDRYRMTGSDEEGMLCSFIIGLFFLTQLKETIEIILQVKVTRVGSSAASKNLRRRAAHFW